VGEDTGVLTKGSGATDITWELYKKALSIQDSSHHPAINYPIIQHSSSTTSSPNLSNNTTAIMQFTIVLATLLSVASAGAITKRYPATLVERAAGVCGGLATALCCQTDVEGVADLNCANGKPSE
jgi:hypothetical protein